MSALREALSLMVTAAPRCNSSAFMFDLVDVAREWLSMGPCLAVRDKIDTKGPAAELKKQVNSLCLYVRVCVCASFCARWWVFDR